MEIETWASLDGVTSPIPNPLPPEISNRELRVSGFAGVWNSPDFQVGKIEAWVNGELILFFQHPLLWGARWAYCGGLYLILIVRHSFSSCFFQWQYDRPINTFPFWEHHASAYYYSSFSNLPDDSFRPSYFYRFPSPYGEFKYNADPPGNYDGVPEKTDIDIHFQKPNIFIDFQLTTASAIGAEKIINQLSGGSFSEEDTKKYPYINVINWNYDVNSKISEILIIKYDGSSRLYPGQDLTNLPEENYYNDYGQGYGLTSLIAKGEKTRFSPFHPDFMEISIKISQVDPCPVKIAIDPAISGSGKDYFCLDYGEYNGLINRFINIDQKLDQLPP